MDREDLVTGLPILLKPCDQCPKQGEACIQGKQTRLPFGTGTNVASKRLQRIHLDTVGELPVPALTGEKYWVTVQDEFTRYCAVLPVKLKSDIPKQLIRLFKYWETQTGDRVMGVRCDRGTEFLNQEFMAFCDDQGIKIETSAPYTPQQNG